MDAYDLFGACASVRSFVDVLTNWYIRRSRQRFWDGDHDAIDTLHTVLERRRAVAAPLLPLRRRGDLPGLHADGGGQRAPHRLADGRRAARRRRAGRGDGPGARRVLGDAVGAQGPGPRVRLPLASLTVAAPRRRRAAPFVDLIADEVNVQEVELTDDVGGGSAGAAGRAGGDRAPPRADTQDVIKAVKAGDWRSRATGASPAGTGSSRASSR